MKNIYCIILIFIGLSFISCDKDLLEKTPLDEIADPEFWNSDTDLELFVNSFYNSFQGWALIGSGASPMPDVRTDVAIFDLAWSGGAVSSQLDGVLNIPTTNGGWDWSNIRNVNYFLENVGRVKEGGNVDQYTGEGYFFRAWSYFQLLKRFGDLPIIDNVVSPDDEESLFSSRSSRTEVVDFIINDLDLAISKMKFSSEVAPSRVNKEIALLFKARVCLYEGTWEKYHEGSVFAGNTNGSEYIQKAEAAAKTLIDNGNYALETGNVNDVYYRLFNRVDYSNSSEVMFYKSYDYLKYGDNFGNQLWNQPNATGITHEMIENYLCTDGLPFAESNLFQGDSLLTLVEINRDPRLAQTVMVPGDIIRISSTRDTTFFTSVFNRSCPTGYEPQKFRQPEVDSRTGEFSQDVGFILFRYAEALLIYAEARAELGTLTQSDIDLTINQLRDRVGMPHLTMGSIVADPNWPDYGYSLPDYLYEIRRERVVELFGEGYRLDDLLRWRAHSIFLGKRPTGIFYTDEYKQIYPNMFSNADGFLDPYQNVLNGPNDGYGFDPDRDYLSPLPSNELTLNKNLDQNPGW